MDNTIYYLLLALLMIDCSDGGLLSFNCTQDCTDGFTVTWEPGSICQLNNPNAPDGCEIEDLEYRITHLEDGSQSVASGYEGKKATPPKPG